MMRGPRIHRRYPREPRDSIWAIYAFECYLAAWQLVRERIVERCMVSMLLAGADDETRQAASESAYWAGVWNEEYTFTTLREAAVRILSKPEPPPAVPRISRGKAEQLAADGIPMAMIERYFVVA